MEHIIYSCEGKDYCLNGGTEGFPRHLIDQVSFLYSSTTIMATARVGFTYFVRYAPLDDRFLVSVIFKGVNTEQESRIHGAAVNYLLSKEEADTFWSGHIRNNFNAALEKAVRLLTEKGYNIPETKGFEEREISDYTEMSKRQALFAALDQANRKDSPAEQTLLGLDEGEDPFDYLEWIAETLPVGIRRNLSFTVGASSVAETVGVTLGFFKNEDLSYFVRNNNFGGAANIVRLIFVEGGFVVDAFLPEQVKRVAELPTEELLRLKNLFKEDADMEKYLILGESLSTGVFNLSLIQRLGEEVSVKAVRQDFFPESFIKELSKARKNLPVTLSAEIMLKEEAIKEREEKKKREEEEEKRRKKEEEKRAKAEKHKKHEKPEKHEESEKDEKSYKGEHLRPKKEKKSSEKKKAFIQKAINITKMVLLVGLTVSVAVIMVSVPVLLFYWAITSSDISGSGIFGTKIAISAFVYGLQIFILTITEIPCSVLLYKLLRLFKNKKKTTTKE